MNESELGGREGGMRGERKVGCEGDKDRLNYYL